MSTIVQDILRIGSVGTRRSENCRLPAGLADAKENYAPDKCVQELFEAQVERSPGAVALVCGSQCFTFRELNTRSNQLARFLKRFGVGPNSLVGLCLERSPEMVVGVLGILKAGAAYVPMDPSLPRDRLSAILQDANIFVLLTQSQLNETLPRHKGPRLPLDCDWDIIARERKANPARRASTKNLAYVIYTSDSTGQPKGVMISHRGLLNYLSWGAEAYELAKGLNTTVDISMPIDLAITRVLSLLMFGRSVFLEERSFDAAQAVHWRAIVSNNHGLL